MLEDERGGIMRNQDDRQRRGWGMSEIQCVDGRRQGEAAKKQNLEGDRQRSEKKGGRRAWRQ